MTDESAGTGHLVWAGEDSEHIRVRSVIGFDGDLLFVRYAEARRAAYVDAVHKGRSRPAAWLRSRTLPTSHLDRVTVRTDVAAWKAAVERFASGDLRGEDELRRLGFVVYRVPVLRQASNSRTRRPHTEGATHAHDESDLDTHRLDD
jgi:hypothetical protein